MKYARHLTLIPALALAGCYASQPDVIVPDNASIPPTNQQPTAVFHTASKDILIAWDDTAFTKDIPGDVVQMLDELQYPDNSERYLMRATPTGNHFVDYYPSFDALKESLTWEEDASEDRTQVAAGCTVVPVEPPPQGFGAYKELCYFNPIDRSSSGTYEQGISIVTYSHCLIPISTAPEEQGVLYFWGIDDDGYDECEFLFSNTQKHLSIAVEEKE